MNGRSATCESCDRRAEHPADRRHDAELELPRTGDRDRLREQTLVERRRRDDDAIDAVEECVVGAELLGDRSRAATASTWMSGKSSSFRRVASASGPSPRISARSGGVTRRQIARAATRNTKTLAATRTQSRSSAEALSSLKPRTRSTVASAAVPASATPTIRPSSSIVRQRIERWSRS